MRGTIADMPHRRKGTKPRKANTIKKLFGAKKGTSGTIAAGSGDFQNPKMTKRFGAHGKSGRVKVLTGSINKLGEFELVPVEKDLAGETQAQKPGARTYRVTEEVAQKVRSPRRKDEQMTASVRPNWRHTISSYRPNEKIALAMSEEMLDKAITEIWNDPVFAGMPAETPDGSVLFVPKEAVSLLRDRGVEFTEQLIMGAHA